MYLRSFRVIEPSITPHIGWLEVGRGLNVFKTSQPAQVQGLLKMLQTVNPPYDCSRIDPFKDLPKFVTTERYTRKIHPARKTAAIAVFAADPNLVKELSAIDPSLYEIDRIECGRRRDRNRWMTFVEILGSARWSEVASPIRDMLGSCRAAAPGIVEQLHVIIENLKDSDRIRGKIAVELKTQLAMLRPLLPRNDQNQLEACLYIINRVERFREAKARVGTCLPLFLSLNKSTITNPASETDPAVSAGTGASILAFLAARLRQNQAETASLQQLVEQLHLPPAVNPGLQVDGETAVLSPAETGAVDRMTTLLSVQAAMHVSLHGYQPIFLVDISEMGLTADEQAELFTFLLEHAAQWQILVIPDAIFMDLAALKSTGGGTEEQSQLRIIDLPTAG